MGPLPLACEAMASRAFLSAGVLVLWWFVPLCMSLLRALSVCLAVSTAAGFLLSLVRPVPGASVTRTRDGHEAEKSEPKRTETKRGKPQGRHTEKRSEKKGERAKGGNAPAICLALKATSSSSRSAAGFFLGFLLWMGLVRAGRLRLCGARWGCAAAFLSSPKGVRGGAVGEGAAAAAASSAAKRTERAVTSKGESERRNIPPCPEGILAVCCGLSSGRVFGVERSGFILDVVAGGERGPRWGTREKWDEAVAVRCAPRVAKLRT